MNDGRPPERWILVLDIPVDGPPPAVVTKRLLKHIWRGWKIRCRGFSQDQKLFDLEEEVKRLQGIIDGLDARVAAQSELLTRRAESNRR